MATGSKAPGLAGALTAVTAVVGTGTAVAVNYATADGSPWWWVAVAGLTVATILVQARLTQARPGSSRPGEAGGPGIVVGGVVGPLTITTHAPGRSPLALLVGVEIGFLAGIALLLLVASPWTERSEPTAPPPQPVAVAPPPVEQDVRMHQVWPSSWENVQLDVPGNDWVLTEFPVTEPWLRSVEVATGSNGDGPVLLQVYDQQGNELASEEVPVADYRAKAVFVKPVDLRAHLGARLLLVLRNTTGGIVTVYLTRGDRDRGVQSFHDCGLPGLTGCPVPGGGDLSAMVIGRARPW